MVPKRRGRAEALQKCQAKLSTDERSGRGEGVFPQIRAQKKTEWDKSFLAIRKLGIMATTNSKLYLEGGKYT